MIVKHSKRSTIDEHYSLNREGTMLDVLGVKVVETAVWARSALSG